MCARLFVIWWLAFSSILLLLSCKPFLHKYAIMLCMDSALKFCGLWLNSFEFYHFVGKYFNCICPHKIKYLVTPNEAHLVILEYSLKAKIEYRWNRAYKFAQLTTDLWINSLLASSRIMLSVCRSITHTTGLLNFSCWRKGMMELLQSWNTTLIALQQNTCISSPGLPRFSSALS